MALNPVMAEFQGQQRADIRKPEDFNTTRFVVSGMMIHGENGIYLFIFSYVRLISRPYIISLITVIISHSIVSGMKKWDILLKLILIGITKPNRQNPNRQNQF